MTATLPGVKDVRSALARADRKFARGSADDEAAPEYLDALARAVEPLVGAIAPGAADSVELEQLRADHQRQTDVVGELRKIVDGHARTADRLSADNKRLGEQAADLARHHEQARTEAAEATTKAGSLAVDLKASKEIAAAAKASESSLRSELEGLRKELVDAYAELSAKDEHRHGYPFTGGIEPGPCSCGHAYPRSVKPAARDDKPAPVEPVELLFARVRDDLKGWPA